MRALRAPVTNPNVEDPSVAPIVDQFVWLNVLNVSIRNCKLPFSVTWTFLNMEAFHV